jgi:type IV pilus assembly protein PilN
MAKINLLPWRIERRKLKQKEFASMLGIAAMIALGLGALWVFYYNSQISGQEKRNQYLTDEIANVQKKLDEIAGLDKKKADLINRKRAIECLQGQRSLQVHLFDDLVRTIPDGVKLVSIKQDGSKLTMIGYSQSNARVSAYMRNLQVAGWMGQPELSIIQAKGADKGLPYEFTLTTTLKNPAMADPDKMADDMAAPATAAGATTAPATPGTPPTATPPTTPAAPAAVAGAATTAATEQADDLDCDFDTPTEEGGV